MSSVLHLQAVKIIFRYLKGQPKLGLWYPKNSPFDLVAYTDSDYVGASLDRKSTTRGCQFFGSRLISWQCKKQTVVANSTTEAEYVAASSCCGQVLWIQNQLLDYGHNLLLLLKVNAVRHNLLLLVNVNDVEVQLQALVDGKKIIITESNVRRDLQLEDAEGVDCLPNSTIFEQLTLMGSKTTAWNEFSSTTASTIICLATNQKFNFSKYIFESMVKNLDNAGNFLMYPRFVQVFLVKQLEWMSNHNRIYVTPSHTKKIFGNMRRVGKGSANPTDPHHTPIIIQPSTSQPQKKQRPRKPKRKDTQIPQFSGPTDNVADEAVNEEMDDSLESAATTATSLDAEQDRGNINKTQSKATPNEDGSQTTKTTQANEITSLKKRVKKLERRNKSRTYGLKRMYKVGLSRRVESSEDEGLGEDDASKQVRRINAIDADEDITLVNNQDDVDMFDVNDLDGDEVIVDNVDVVKTSEETRSVVEEVTDVEVTLAQALTKLKSAKPKAVRVVIQEPEQVGIKRLLDDLRVTAAQLKEFDDPTKGILLLGQQVVSELVALRNFARRYGSRFFTHGGCI
ncbi:hypothetical protein Tco_1560734 [Tanacetum coccineum]